MSKDHFHLGGLLKPLAPAPQCTLGQNRGSHGHTNVLLYVKLAFSPAYVQLKSSRPNIISYGMYYTISFTILDMIYRVSIKKCAAVFAKFLWLQTC